MTDEAIEKANVTKSFVKYDREFCHVNLSNTVAVSVKFCKSVVSFNKYLFCNNIS